MDLKSIQSDIVTSAKASGFDKSAAEAFVSSYKTVEKYHTRIEDSLDVSNICK